MVEMMVDLYSINLAEYYNEHTVMFSMPLPTFSIERAKRIKQDAGRVFYLVQWIQIGTLVITV
jgi:hypothetical protein